MLRKILLYPFSLVYWLITALRNLAFNRGWLPQTRFEIPLVVIGNLSTGGTGKTPHAEWILRLMSDKKRALISRGYGRRSRGFLWVDENGSALQYGDEPLQIRRKFRDVPVAVCEDRVLAVPELLGEYEKTELIVLDDAFQHRYLRGSFYILLTPYEELYSHDWLLPAGNLREHRSGSRRADVILVTKCPETLTQEDRQRIIRQLRPEARQKVFFSHFKAGSVQTPDGRIVSEEEFRNKKLVLISGIAGGDRWARSLVPQSAGLLRSFEYPDHHIFRKEEIGKIVEYCRAVSEPYLLLTTEKDLTRLLDSEGDFRDLPLVFLPIEVELTEGADWIREKLNEQVQEYHHYLELHTEQGPAGRES